MNWKYLLAPVVIGATLAATLLAQAAPGDVLVKLNSVPVTLDAPQKVLAGAALVAVFPAADAAAVTRFGCHKQPVNQVICSGAYTRVLSRAAFIAEAAAGVSGTVASYDGSDVTFEQIAKPKLADAVALTALTSLVSSVCPVDISKIVDIRLVRNGADIDAQCGYIDTVSQADYMTLLQAGQVIQTIDLVE